MGRAVSICKAKDRYSRFIYTRISKDQSWRDGRGQRDGLMVPSPRSKKKLPDLWRHLWTARIVVC